MQHMPALWLGHPWQGVVATYPKNTGTCHVFAKTCCDPPSVVPFLWTVSFLKVLKKKIINLKSGLVLEVAQYFLPQFSDN
jgi:hypothetical protein